MDPVTGTDVFQQDPEMLVEEQDDGSAIIEMEVEEEVESDFYSNLAETLDDFTLNSAASSLLDLIEKDKEARKKRDEQYEDGLRRTGLGDDAPGGAMFTGASRAVHPVLAEGCVDFAARTIKELFPANGPVKTKIHGKSDTKKLDLAKRKRDYLNFLLTKRMRSYRDEKEILLTQLPLGGSQYEKYYPDFKTGNYVMEFVPVDKLLLPYSATSFYDTPRLTQLVDLTRQKFEARIAEGFYRDIRIQSEEIPEETVAEKANDKIEGVEATHYNVDGLRLVYEIACSWSFEEGEEESPYIIHLDEPTGKIVAVYRNWKEDDEHKAKLDWWIENKFIPWRGAYGIGLPHLIGGLAAALTGALRALLDSAHINNSPGAVKLKGGRASGQNITIEQTQVAELEAPPGVDDIRKVMMPLPFNPPSAVLFQLLEWITNQAKGVVATAEERIAEASNNMPVGTALALIEQGSQVFSAIHARLHESQRRGFEIICRLIHDYPNAEDLARFELRPEDFKDNDDISPVSDPNIFSEAQRFAQLQEVLKLTQMFQEQKWNRNALARRSLELLRVDYADEVLPALPDPVTADPITENVAAMRGAPVKAAPQQDHQAHILTHLRFIVSGPHLLTTQPNPAIAGLYNHVLNEHMLLLYKNSTEMAGQQLAQQVAMSGAQMSPDAVAMQAADIAKQQLAPFLQQVAQLAAEAQQIVDAKSPKPPVDPAVEKTFEAAMAEIERKKAFDAESLKLKQQEVGIKPMLAQMQEETKMSIAEARNFADLQIASAREQAQQLADELRAQVDLMKNEQDNQQHQHTEIVKNLQDNQTQLRIAMEKGLTDVRNSVPQTPDMTPVIDQLNQMLAGVEKQKSADSLSAVMQGLQAVIETLNRPKMIMTDEQGRPIGIQ